MALFGTSGVAFPPARQSPNLLLRQWLSLSHPCHLAGLSPSQSLWQELQLLKWGRWCWALFACNTSPFLSILRLNPVYLLNRKLALSLWLLGAWVSGLHSTYQPTWQRPITVWDRSFKRPCCHFFPALRGSVILPLNVLCGMQTEWSAPPVFVTHGSFHTFIWIPYIVHCLKSPVLPSFSILPCLEVADCHPPGMLLMVSCCHSLEFSLSLFCPLLGCFKESIRTAFFKAWFQNQQHQHHLRTS